MEDTINGISTVTRYTLCKYIWSVSVRTLNTISYYYVLSNIFIEVKKWWWNSIYNISVAVLKAVK